VVALLGTAAIDTASAASTSATVAPTVGKVRARIQTTKGQRTTWLLTAIAVDRDGDLIGGLARIKIGAKGKVLSRRIVRAQSRSTSGRASGAAEGIRSATLARRTLRVVFYADVAPGPVNVTFWVTDTRRHNSKRVVLRLRVRPTETVSIAATDPTASEPSSAGAFTVTRTGGGTTSPLTVSYAVSGTATSGSDFAALSGSVTIPIGRTSATIAVTPVDDDTIETSETVVVTLAASPAYIVGAASTATVGLTSDDVPTTVTVTAFDAAAAEPTATGSFRIARTGRTTSSLAVTYSVTGTATAGTDYTTLTGTVTIPVGATSATIAVTPIDDTTVETPETVIMTLRESTRYTIGTPSTATVTITDNDVLSTVTIDATDDAAAEPSGTGTFTVTRTGSTTTALTVTYALGGTATSGSDYAAAPASPLTIPAGATSATITVTPIDDSVVESDETVVATLMAGTGYEIGTPSTATVTISDDEPAEPPEPVVTIEATDATAAEPANSGTFTVTRTGSTTASLDVFYTVTGDATNGTDYTALAGSITIPAGQSTATITVSPIDDPDAETDEEVTLTLVDVAGYTVGTANSGTVTIADDD
jgi:Calx-beta domain